MTMDAWWTECERWLPAGWHLAELRRQAKGGWMIVARGGVKGVLSGEGATPAAAVAALAMWLRDSQIAPPAQS
jgi:hypothetical protein